MGRYFVKSLKLLDNWPGRVQSPLLLYSPARFNKRPEHHKPADRRSSGTVVGGGVNRALLISQLCGGLDSSFPSRVCSPKNVGCLWGQLAYAEAVLLEILRCLSRTPANRILVNRGEISSARFESSCFSKAC